MSISRRGGGIGRRAGLKIRFRKEWGFDSPPRHQGIKIPVKRLGFFYVHQAVMRVQYVQNKPVQLIELEYQRLMRCATS